MFSLRESDLSQGVLDCAGGPSSFTAEAAAARIRAVSVDPLYRFSEEEIRSRFEAVAVPLLDQVRAAPERWVWHFHPSPDHLLACRRSALEAFLSDYADGKAAGRYRIGELPCLPFGTGSFGLALCSHLLFLYSDLLDETFHVQAVRELCRIAAEIRVFPIVSLAGGPSPHLPAVLEAIRELGRTAEIVPVEHEFQRGAKQMLRIPPLG